MCFQNFATLKLFCFNMCSHLPPPAPPEQKFGRELYQNVGRYRKLWKWSIPKCRPIPIPKFWPKPIPKLIISVRYLVLILSLDLWDIHANTKFYVWFNSKKSLISFLQVSTFKVTLWLTVAVQIYADWNLFFN